jgi:hypothetical protein
VTKDELREKAARAMREVWRDQCDVREVTSEWPNIERGEQIGWIDQADAALAVVREALREPTREMMAARQTSLVSSDPAAEWRAMFAASPLGGGDE